MHGISMNQYCSVERALMALKEGKIVLVTDDEERENEGDLICAAEFATTENVNFMASYAKGLICMPMSQSVADAIGVYPMVNQNQDNHETAFTVSIDYKTTSTGISAEERGITARMCTKDGIKKEEFRRPGHMFPLIAKEKGLFERRGHTEATVDLMRLVGLKECGLCCEIMREDGTMMRTTELLEFARRHELPFITVNQIIEYRRSKETFVELVTEAKMPTKYGEFRIYGFENTMDGKQHVALVKGKIAAQSPVLCRVHSECLTGDALGSMRCDCGQQYDAAMKEIAKRDAGILIYLRQEGRGIGLLNKLKAYELQDKGLDTVEANLALGFEEDMRNYCEAAQILKKLKVKEVELLTNNPDKIEQLQRYGIKVVNRIPLQMKASPYDLFYLRTKQEKMRHLVQYE